MIRINKVHKIWRQSRDVLAGLAFIATGLGCTASDVPIALESQTAIPNATETGETNDRTEDFKTLLENYTPDGKPTRTIETPWGPREIYDPLQDEVVKSAFKWGYNQNDPTFRPTYTRDPKYSHQYYILKSAMFAQVYAYQNLSCKFVETSDCNTSFSDYKCERGQSCKYSTITIGPGMRSCLVDFRRVYNISTLRIGKYSHENWPYLTQEEQLKNLFLVNCKSYTE